MADDSQSSDRTNGKQSQKPGSLDDFLAQAKRLAESMGAGQPSEPAGSPPPDEAETLHQVVMRAKSAEDEQRWEDAIEAHRRVAELSEEFRAAAWERIGDLYRDRLQQPDRALEAYQRSLEAEPGRITTAIEIAQTYERLERWEDAAAAYRLVAKLSDKYRPAALGKVAHMLAKLGKTAEAETAMKMVQSAYPDDYQVAIAVATFYEELGRWDEAIDAYERAVGMSEEHRPTLLGRIGVMLARAGRVAEAEAALMEAELAYPDDLEVMGARAKFYETLEHWQEAIAMHQRIADRSPEYRAAAWEHIGDLYRDKVNDAEQAIRAYNQSLAVEPGRISAIIELAETFERQQRWEEAIEAHRRVADTSERYRAAAWERIGDLCRDKLGQPERALEAYARSLAVQPGRITVIFEMARTYEEMQRWDDAITAYRHAAGVSPPHRPTALGNVALVLAKAGRADEAEAALREAEAAFPGDLELIIARATLFELLERWEEAAAVHRQIAGIAREYEPVALSKAAMALVKAGKVQEAEALLRGLRDSHPDDPIVAIVLANFYDEQQCWEEAVAAHRHVAGLLPDMRGEALLRAASIYLEKLGWAEESLELLAQSLPYWQHDPVNVLMQVARAHEMVGRRAEAEHTYRQMEELLTHHLSEERTDTVLRRLGWVKYKTGRFEEVLPLLNEVSETPESIDKARARVIEAALAFLAGDVEQAGVLVRRAMDEFAAFPPIQDDLRWEGIHDIRIVAAWHHDNMPVEGFAALFGPHS